MTQLPEDFYAGDLFGEIHQAEIAPEKRPRTAYLPGLAICATASLAAMWLAEYYAFPLILLGLLIGLALSFASEDARTHAGLDFAARHGLRLGIVVLGLQITAPNAFQLVLIVRWQRKGLNSRHVNCWGSRQRNCDDGLSGFGRNAGIEPCARCAAPPSGAG